MVLVGCSLKSKARQVLTDLIIAAVSLLTVTNCYLFVTDFGHQVTLEFKRRYGRWNAAKSVNRKRIVVKKYSSSNNQSNEKS